jgi:VWFA-related protein
MNAMCGILLGASVAFGQQAPVPAPNPEKSGVVFSVTSTLVQVDAVVTDGKGRNISDLAPDDFQVLIDGKPQPLTHFSYVRLSTAAPTTAPGVAPARAAKSGPDLPPPPAAQLRPQDVRRTIVVMVDDLGLSFESMAFVRSSLRKFVENQMEPGDLVAVLRTGAGSGALQQFTADKRILLSVIDGLRWNPHGRSGVSPFEPLGMYSNPAERVGGEAQSGDWQSVDVRYEIQNGMNSTIGTLGAVSHTIDALREMPGRKSIVLFSDGMIMFPPAAAGPFTGDHDQVLAAMRKLIDRANRAGTVIYTIQATGLQTAQLDAADRVSGNPNLLHQFTEVGHIFTEAGHIANRDWLLNASQQGLAYLADETGGLAYDNGNSLNFGLERMLEDQKGYYLLGFHPPQGLFLEKSGQPGFHGLAVKVERAGLHVRSRTGFFGETDDQVAVQKPRNAVEQMRAAMLSPFHSADVGLRLTALYAEAAKNLPVVRNLLHIDAKDLTWNPGPDGATATLQVVAVATGAGDVALDTVARQYVLTAAQGKLTGVIRDGAIYTLDVPVPKRGAYQIRVAVRDDASGKVGSASQFIEIPELKKARFALASIILQDGGSAARNIDLLKIAPARRQFRQGSDMEYYCAVSKGGDRQATTDLETEIHIVSEGKEVYSTAAKVVNLPGTGPAVYGAVRLTDKLAPGEYYLHLIAKDPRGGKNAAADQWTDFRVIE